MFRDECTDVGTDYGGNGMRSDDKHQLFLTEGRVDSHQNYEHLNQF